MKVRLTALVALLLAATLPVAADPRAEPWIAKARAAYGPDELLDAVRSIHYVGTLETVQKVPVDGDPSDLREQTVVLAIDIIFQKPFQQRMTLRSDRIIEVTALDDSDGWVRLSPAGDEGRGQLSILDTQQVRRLRANTWENLAFFRGLDRRRGGSISYGGDAEVEGRDCAKIVFTHDENIVFTRFFEKATGHLVKTVTESGGEIREEGEIMAQGLRFPRQLINRAPNGQIATITFEKVTVNEVFPPEVFAVPLLLPRR